MHKGKIQILGLSTITPPQLWERKKRLEIILKEARKKNPSLRTQIRMGENDISLYTKIVGENFYSWTPLTKFGDPNEPQDSQFDTLISRKRKELTPDMKNRYKKAKNNTSENGDEDMTDSDPNQSKSL